MKKTLTLGFFILGLLKGMTWSVFAQNISERDSLQNVLLNSTTPQEKLSLLYDLGWTFYPNNPDSMEHYFGQVISQTNDTSLIAKSERGIGVSLYLKTDYDQAMLHNLKALSAFQAMGDEYGMAKTYNSIGLNLASMKSYQPALEYHWHSIYLAKKLLNRLQDTDSVQLVKSMIGHNYINLSVSYEEAPEKDSALFYTQKSIELFRELDSPFYLAMSYNRRAQAFYRMGNYKEALKLNKYVLDNFNELNPFEETFTYLGLAQNLVELGTPKEAEEFALKGYKLAKEIGATWHLQHCMRVLAQSYKLQENYQKAYQYHVEYKAISDSLFNEGNEKRINYMLLQQKDLENDRLKQQNQLNEEQLIIKNQQILLFIIGVLSLSFFVLFQYRHSRKLKNLNAQLNTLNQQFKASNATKDKFFSIIAHDLKSPFNAIVGFISILKIRMEKFSKEELLEYIDLMLVTTNNTYKLLENILTWSRLQTGDMPYEPKVVELKTLISESIALLTKIAQEKDIQLTVKDIANTPVYADENMIATVLRNLVNNAIKFTKRGGEVTIYSAPQHEMMEVYVQDTGEGITPFVLERLFLVSEKISTAGTENEKGTGLGLTLSKEFVERHGGTIKVKSEEKKGSVFSFTLPLA